MKERGKNILYFVLLVLSVCLMIAAAALGERAPGPLVAGIFAVGGMLLGAGAVGLILTLAQRRMTPEERRQAELGETDERNVAIREKAAYSSWYWTLYMLWAAFILVTVFVRGFASLLASAACVLHCVFYMINIGRWARKM